MQGSPTSSTCAVTAQSSIPSMQIPIQLIVPAHTIKVINTHALVDSGTDISCINWNFVKKYQLSIMKLEIPIQAQNADNSCNKKGDILYTCTLSLNVEDITLKTTLYVMACMGQHHSRITLAHRCQPLY